MKPKKEDNKQVHAGRAEPLNAIKRAGCANRKISSFRVSSSRLRAIALISEAALLNSTDGELGEFCE
jgi:hypothetical protein